MGHDAAAGGGAPRKKGIKTLGLMVIVAVVSTAAGFAVPQFLGGATPKSVNDAPHEGDEAEHETATAGHGSAHGAALGSGHGSGHGAAPSKSKKGGSLTGLAYVPFGDVVANLDDTRMMRYTRAKFSLAVDKKEAESVTALVEENKTLLKNWLIGYLQNKQIDEVRGTEGYNRIRREIQDRFNDLLFPDGEAKIRDILFEEFNVQ
jgi:flagellar protein FliL